MTPILPLASLDAIERAALALLNAVQTARGASSSSLQNFPTHSPGGPTVVEVANEFLLSKANALRSEGYIRVCHTQLTAFCEGRLQRPLASVTAREIDDWLGAHNWGPETRYNNLMTVRTLFNFAIRRNYVVGNPALAVDLPILDSNPPGIHTPGEVSAVLHKARDLDLNTLRYLAIRYFAGLRGSEAAALDESQIQTERGFIEVTAANAKTRKRRLVTIQPALASWLALGGRLPLGDVNTKLWRVTSAVSFQWPRNVTRHSFVSYHLAQFGSASKTALEAGHTEQILFNNYRELVTPATAAEFWAIRPK